MLCLSHSHSLCCEVSVVTNLSWSGVLWENVQMKTCGLLMTLGLLLRLAGHHRVGAIIPMAHQFFVAIVIVTCSLCDTQAQKKMHMRPPTGSKYKNQQRTRRWCQTLMLRDYDGRENNQKTIKLKYFFNTGIFEFESMSSNFRCGTLSRKLQWL